MKFNKALIFSLMFFIILLSLGMAAADDDQTDGNSTGNNTTDLNQSEEYSNVTEDTGIVNGTLPIYPPENNATTDISYAAYEEPVHKDNGTAAVAKNNHTKNATVANDNHATGNPLGVLLFAISGIGVASLRRRRK